MKIYYAECISGAKGSCGIYSTMNLAISEIIHHNNFRTDIPTILIEDKAANIVYEGNDDYNYVEYYVKECELNKWED